MKLVHTFVVVVTHVVRGETGGINGGLLRVCNLFWDRKGVSGSVYGGTDDGSGSLLLGVGEARSVNGGADTDVCLSLDGGGRVLRNVNGVVDFFLVGWLKARSITTFSQIDFGVVVTARRNLEVDVSIRVSLVWKLDVDVGVLGFVFLRSVVKKREC